MPHQEKSDKQKLTTSKKAEKNKLWQMTGQDFINDKRFLWRQREGATYSCYHKGRGRSYGMKGDNIVAAAIS